MKTNARQFFDIWATCVTEVEAGRRIPELAHSCKAAATYAIGVRHGEKIAQEAEHYFEKLKADTQAGSPPKGSAYA